jgi:hypothetical protein
VRTTQRQFAIPFRLPTPDTPDATVQQVKMSVSTDFGLSWTPAGSTSPQILRYHLKLVPMENTGFAFVRLTAK